MVTADDSGNNLSLIVSQAATSHCFSEFIVDLVVDPKVCFIGLIPDILPLEAIESAIVQSGDTNSKPFHDTGLDGRGEIVALSDSCLDTDICYFIDEVKEVSKDTSKTFDPTVRKVVQYFASADFEERFGGHGTQVAATLAGSSDNGLEDGVAKGAKISFFDVGNAATNSLDLPRNIFLSLMLAMILVLGCIPLLGGSIPTTTPHWTKPSMHMRLGIRIFLLVVACGKMGDAGLNTVGSPVNAKNCLSVGANKSSWPNIAAHMMGSDYLASFIESRANRRRTDKTRRLCSRNLCYVCQRYSGNKK